MTSHKPHFAVLLAGLISVSVLSSRPATAQTVDSSRSATGNALQFQIVGGVGVYYIAGGSGCTFYRIGADASIHSANSSGTQTSSSQYSGSDLSTTSGPQDQSQSSFRMSLTGLWLTTIAEYSRASIYAGGGPVVSYASGKDTYGSTYNYSGGGAPTIASSVNTSSTWGLGPLALIGIRARAFNPVSLTAEMSFSAQYKWTSMATTSTNTYGGQVPAAVTISSGESTLKGWSLDLQSIQIGVIVEL